MKASLASSRPAHTCRSGRRGGGGQRRRNAVETSWTCPLTLYWRPVPEPHSLTMCTPHQPQSRHHQTRNPSAQGDVNTSATDRPESRLTAEVGSATPEIEPQPTSERPISRRLDAGSRTCVFGARADRVTLRCRQCLNLTTLTRRRPT